MIHSSEILLHIYYYTQEQRGMYGNLQVEFMGEPKVGSRHTGIKLLISQMYEHVDFSFSFLEMLSKTLKTKNIDIGDKRDNPGCDTCDHGSSYTCILRIGDIKSEVHIDAVTLNPPESSWFGRSKLGQQNEDQPSVFVYKKIVKNGYETTELGVDARFKKFDDKVKERSFGVK